MSTILVVDDEPSIRDALGRYLEQRGDHRVLFAEDGIEALAVLGREHVDFAFIDLHMPRMSGIELVQQCGRKYPDLQYVVMSGYDEVIALAREKLRPRPLLLRKPFELRQIDGIVPATVEGE